MINLEYNGKSFNQREEDGYVNVGQLCATHDKRFHDWYRTQSAIDYINATAETLTVSDVHIFTIDNLVQKDMDAIGGKSGTWAHPLIALEVARWISPQFGVWCNTHIRTLMETGTTSIIETNNVDVMSNSQFNQLITLITELKADNKEQKENMQILLADKSEKEMIGELVSSKFEGISDLLKGVLGEIARKYGDDINKMYKIRPYYTLKEIALRFFPEDKVEKIVNKARCNINGLYKSMTKLLLPQEKGNYQYDKTNVIFALWRLHHCAKELGLNVEFIDLKNKEYINLLEDLFEE